MANWTPKQVEDRLIEAADVLKRLPEQKVQGYFSVWPEVVRSFADMVGQEPVPMRRPLPSAAAITSMEETLTWVRFLEPIDGKLLWARAEGAPWKAICWRFGVTRSTAHRRWQYGLSVIALKLSGKRVYRGQRRSTRAGKSSNLYLTH